MCLSESLWGLGIFVYGFRNGVTEAALKLQKAGLIQYARGRITVLDRPGLEVRSCECYAVVKKEYDRLLPVQLTPHAP